MTRDKARWTFFSNHGHVYFLLASDQDMTLRDVATRVGITERSVLGIVQDLEEAGYIERKRSGRVNKYKILPRKKLRHPLEADVRLKDLTELIKTAKEG